MMTSQLCSQCSSLPCQLDTQTGFSLAWNKNPCSTIRAFYQLGSLNGKTETFSQSFQKNCMVLLICQGRSTCLPPTNHCRNSIPLLVHHRIQGSSWELEVGPSSAKSHGLKLGDRASSKGSHAAVTPQRKDAFWVGTKCPFNWDLAWDGDDRGNGGWKRTIKTK
jgi:hypothetical protein